jgi:hypothetical protein
MVYFQKISDREKNTSINNYYKIYVVPNKTNFTSHCGQGCGKIQAKYLYNIFSNTRIIHILVNTPTKVKIFPGSEGVKMT